MLCDFIVHCLRSNAAHGETFDVTDGKPLSTRQLILQLAKLHDRKVSFINIPEKFLEHVFGLISKNFASQFLADFVLDDMRVQSVLDWSPQVTGNISRM